MYFIALATEGKRSVGSVRLSRYLAFSLYNFTHRFYVRCGSMPSRHCLGLKSGAGRRP
jgi:hypothetical protein